ncbi:polyphosphate polymerase domain-containing protein [Baekduia soli]|uniref:polyphosphate polymerase domain-containing protein n=1 Tax=Baekduia soli TaxID=496014 RepID=UPI0016524F08|nr:polyphosphate polymerase domain-containing protein [Baekduia soli]
MGLDELQADAALHTRIDRKYVVDWAMFAELTEGLANSHRALEIDSRRTFRYETVYFDSPALTAFRAHMQQRRRRYKARSRRYVDSGLHLFEVKLKGARDETIKHQLPYAADDHGRVTEQARAFLEARVAEAYPRMAVPTLAPTLRTDYERVTLAHGPERVTCDFALSFADATGRMVPGLDPGHVILESKCERGLGAVDRALRTRGISPVSCSKYCVGVGLLRTDVKTNDLRWLLSRYFGAMPLGARAMAHGPAHA